MAGEQECQARVSVLLKCKAFNPCLALLAASAGKKQIVNGPRGLRPFNPFVPLKFDGAYPMGGW